jgi:hypothetical protein
MLKINQTFKKEDFEFDFKLCRFHGWCKENGWFKKNCSHNRSIDCLKYKELENEIRNKPMINRVI